MNKRLILKDGEFVPQPTCPCGTMKYIKDEWSFNITVSILLQPADNQFKSQVYNQYHNENMEVSIPTGYCYSCGTFCGENGVITLMEPAKGECDGKAPLN